MSFNNRGGNFRGGRGGQGRGGQRGGRGGRGGYNQGPQDPGAFIQIGEFNIPCKDQIIVKVTNMQKVPKFNRPVFLENKTQIGQIDEILGPINSYLFSVSLANGMVATSFKQGQKIYMNENDCLPYARFLPQNNGSKPQSGGRGGGQQRGGRGGQRGGPRGGGGFRGGRGGNRGGFRGR